MHSEDLTESEIFLLIGDVLVQKVKRRINFEKERATLSILGSSIMGSMVTSFGWLGGIFEKRGEKWEESCRLPEPYEFLEISIGG